MLRMNRIKLELISETDKHLFIEKGLRGGISYICKRFSEASNKHMKIVNLQKKANSLWFLMKSIYMARVWVNIFLVENLSG